MGAVSVIVVSAISLYFVGENTKTNRQKNKLTHDELLNAFMSLIPEGDEEGVFTECFRVSLLRSLLDANEKKTHTVEEVKRQLEMQ